MITSELITPQHLTRKAIIYIRQSSPHQVLTNQESLRLQYALRERAVELGWRSEEIEIIDGDLGLSGAATHYREGFKELLSRVTLGEVGIILSVEVQRLSRNCSDWYPLLDIWGYKHCLIADRDGVYDPGTPNGRLLLLKSDGCKANDQRQVPSMAVSIQLGGKILDTKNAAETAQPAYNREVATPTDSPGGPSACVYPVYHSASPMR
jgi:Resolvase, N terminal domain